MAWEPIRIGASAVGACIGVHPYAELDETIDGLVYQGAFGRAVLASDAAVCGAVVESREEACVRILEGASPETRRAFGAADDAARRDAAVVGDVASATALSDRVVAEAVRRREVSAEEAAVLRRFAREAAHTEFGRRHETGALRAYERQTGNAVRDGTAARHELRFPRDAALAPKLVVRRPRDRFARRLRAFAASDDGELALPATLRATKGCLIATSTLESV